MQYNKIQYPYLLHIWRLYLKNIVTERYAAWDNWFVHSECKQQCERYIMHYLPKRVFGLSE